jgi:hypothetical protein
MHDIVPYSAGRRSARTVRRLGRSSDAVEVMLAGADRSA